MKITNAPEAKALRLELTITEAEWLMHYLMHPETAGQGEARQLRAEMHAEVSLALADNMAQWGGQPS